MYFKDIAWKPLAEEQLALQDKAAIQLTKKNCLVLATLLKAHDIEKFPKPAIPTRDYYHQLWSATSYPDNHCGWLNLILHTAADADYNSICVKPQELVNIAYFFACNGYLIELGKYYDWHSEFVKWVCGWFAFYVKERDDLDTESEYILTFTRVRSEVPNVDPSKMSLSDFGVTTVSEGSDFPEDLAQHLAQFGSIDLLVTEVCRIMMLSPKYKRADDAMQALLDVWQTLKKQKS